MRGDRITCRDKNHRLESVPLLRLLFDTAAPRREVTGAVESAPTMRQEGSLDVGKRWGPSGRAPRKGGFMWEKAVGPRGNPPSFPT